MSLTHPLVALVRVFTMLLAVVAFSGCARPCPPSAFPKLVVWVNDTATDEPITQATVTAVAEADGGEFPLAEQSDGNYASGPDESLPTPGAGTYTIRVTRDGFIPIEAQAVITPDHRPCDPPIILQLRLQRESD